MGGQPYEGRLFMKIKKLLALVLTGAILAGCGASSGGGASTTAAEATTTAAEETSAAEETPAAEGVHFDTLKLAFVPSRDPDEIIQQTSALPEMLKTELAKQGYEVDEITIEVSSSFEVAGESLSSGAVDLAWLPSGTYLTYSDECDVILTATRAGLSNDSEDPRDWCGLENKTLRNGPQVSYYKALIYAGPSEKGQELSAKVLNGEELTWEDLSSAKWCVSSNPTSNAGYSFPTLWLMEHYDGKKITDIPAENVLTDNYGGAFMKAAAEQADIIVCYADGRDDYQDAWNKPAGETFTAENGSEKVGFGREKEIWEELNVIGVTNNIYNDTISITKAKEEVYNEDFINAFCNAMEAICETEEGKKIIYIYTHEGYLRASDSDYDSMRNALEAVQ